MRVKQLKNVSPDSITIQESNGMVCVLPSGSAIHNRDVVNISELTGKAVIVYDLGEVNESKNKTRLFD